MREEMSEINCSRCIHYRVCCGFTSKEAVAATNRAMNNGECLLCFMYKPTADVVEIPESGIGNLSDGYHTFNELYHHRAILFSVICNSMPEKAWKSKLHDTGDMYEGMFIVGIETPEGQATYHYDIEPYWDMFKVKELEKAPNWDGHTPQDAIERISKISADVVEVVRCADCKYYHPYETPIEGFDGCCNVHEIECNKDFYCQYGQRRAE